MNKTLIGTSLTGCLDDILNLEVDPYTVVAIITNTLATDRDEFIQLIRCYQKDGTFVNRSTSMSFAPDTVMQTALGLYDSGLIHQPRNFGAYSNGIAYLGRWLYLAPVDKGSSPATIKAYDQWRMMLELEQ